MRRAAIAVLAAVALVASSCSDDREEPRNGPAERLSAVAVAGEKTTYMAKYRYTSAGSAQDAIPPCLIRTAISKLSSRLPRVRRPNHRCV